MTPPPEHPTRWLHLVEALDVFGLAAKAGQFVSLRARPRPTCAGRASFLASHPGTQRLGHDPQPARYRRDWSRALQQNHHLFLYAARDGQDGDPDLTTDTATQSDGTIQIREAPAAPTSPPLIYGTGQAGTVKPSCKLTPFAPTAGQRVTVVCKGTTSTNFSLKAKRATTQKTQARRTAKATKTSS